jgi:hypothetical protein
MNPPADVTVENSSLAISLGLKLGSWFQGIGSQIGNILSRGLLNVKSLLSNMVNGAKELFGAIARGDWNLFKNWLKEDPVAVTAGAVAVVLIGGLVVGAVAGGVAAIATAIAGAGAVGGITLAGIMPSLVQSAVGGAETIYNFDFNKFRRSAPQRAKSGLCQLCRRRWRIARAMARELYYWRGQVAQAQS